MSSIIKGMQSGKLAEAEYITILYIDGKPITKYASGAEAREAYEHMKKKFPNLKIELKPQSNQSVLEDGKLDPNIALKQAREITHHIKYDTSVNEIVAEIKNLAAKSNVNIKTLNYSIDAVYEAHDALEAAVYNLEEAFNDAVEQQEIDEDTSYSSGGGQGGYAGQSYRKFKAKPAGLDEDYTGKFAAEKTPEINPYAGTKDKQFRGAISEEPDTSGPVGVQPGGWRTYRPKPAGMAEEKESAYGPDEELADLSKINTKTLQSLHALHKHYGQKNPRNKASAERIAAELKKRGIIVAEKKSSILKGISNEG